MDTCIICRKETNDFSDEHVIPDSLGGYYHIYSVCKTCNSDLGSNVDSDLVNHKFSDFQRYLLGISLGKYLIHFQVLIHLVKKRKQRFKSDLIVI